MPVFTTLATALLAGTALASSTFAIGAVAFGLSTVTSIGLSYAARALAGNQTQTPSAATVDHFSAQGTLQAAGDVPRSFNVGYSVTAGSLAYANTWGNDGETPNAFFTQVVHLSDLPGGTIVEIWINGELCTLGPTPHAQLGYPVTQYTKDGKDHLWIKYHDGTQTTADSALTTLVASAERPYPSTRVGYGIAYAICTALVDDTLFNGFPTFKFALSGIPLYDPSKDSTNGGSGSHRYSDPTTWGGDGDNFPAVQIYNILRGIHYNGTWLYGLQSMTAARLPSVNWVTQINKCRATITGESGLEPTYRSGGQINVSAQPANAIEALLTACQGRLSEIGGFYKVHLGTPDSPGVGSSFTDGDILSSEEQNFAPFFGLADSINGITATYPFPGEAWNTKAAPPLFRSDLETRDGSRRLLANPAFDFVPYSAQVQRLMKSALEEAQRARRHTVVLPPAYWILEPGDTVTWSSVRNGYSSKQFRVDGIVDKANLDVIANVTEVDPADYDWDHNVDFQGVSQGPTVFERPSPQGILDWFAEPWTIRDADGFGRRPAIRLSWDGSLPGVSGVQYEVRLASDQSDVTRGRTDQLAFGAIIISQSLLPDTDYEARGQYLPSSPRDMLWSDWLAVTTPDVRLSLAELDAGIVAQVTTIFGSMQDQIDKINGAFDAIENEISRNWNDKKEVRGQVSAQFDIAYADITEVQTVAADTQAAFASFTTTITAAFGSVSAQVTTNSSAIAQLNGYAAARYSVTLDVNGNASGFTLLNGGAGYTSFTVLADKFQVALPGFSGGNTVPVFTIATVGGAPKLAFRGDMIGDGSITTQKILAGSVTTITLAAEAVTADKVRAKSLSAGQIAAGIVTSDSGLIGALGVKSLSIGDEAVIVPRVQSLPAAFGGLGTSNSISVSIDTTGLAGKTITIFASWMSQISNVVPSQFNNASIYVNNVLIAPGSQSLPAAGSINSWVITGLYSYPASGGVDVIPVRVDVNIGSQTSISNRSLIVQVVKR